jgi:hypothetical protein
MVSILADCLAAFATGAASLLGVEFVRGTFLVRSLAALTRDFALLLAVHYRKTTSALGVVVLVVVRLIQVTFVRL